MKGQLYRVAIIHNMKVGEQGSSLHQYGVVDVGRFVACTYHKGGCEEYIQTSEQVAKYEHRKPLIFQKLIPHAAL